MIRNRKAGLVLLAVLWSPIGLLADEWYENYERALEHIQRQEWQTALDYLNEAVDAKPEPKQNAKTYGLRFIDYFPYLYRGVAQWELGNYDLAGKNLTKSETLGEVLKASKDKDAPSLLRTYLGLVEKRKVQEREKVVKSMFDEAKGLYEQEKFEAAKEKFNELLGFEPSHPGASQYLTQIEDQLNPKQPAVAKTDKSDRVNKEFTAGLELFLQRQFTAAEKKFKNVLTLDAQHPSARKYLGLIEAEKQKPVSSPSDPAPSESAEQLFNRGVAHFDAGQFREAKANFLNSRELDPQHSGVQDYLNRIAEIEGRVRRGVTAYFEGDYDQAISELSGMGTEHQMRADFYGFLAYAYAAKFLLEGEQDPDLRRRAIENFKKAKEIDPNYSPDGGYISPRITLLLSNL